MGGMGSAASDVWNESARRWQDVEASPYGRKFEVPGNLEGPSGRGAEVVTIWIVPLDSDSPKFLTAFPG